MTEEQKKHIALFRFGVIGELVGRRDLSWGERERTIRQLSQRQWQIPGSARTRIGCTTIREWLHRYEQSGAKIESLFPKGRSDAGSSRRLDEETEAALVNLKRELAEASLPSLLAVARRRKIIGPRFEVSKQTLYRLFARYGLNEAKAPEQDRRRFEVGSPNELWQSDCMHGPRVMVDGKLKPSFLFGLIDDHSRLIPHAQFYLRENIDCYQDCLIQAFAKRGLPRKLFVDNGPSFRSERLRYACASLGVALIYAKPYSGASKGKIERLWRTVRMQLLERIPEALSLQELNERLQRWIDTDYHVRPHGSTAQTPLERYLKAIELIRPAPKSLRDFFRTPAFRTVDRNTSTVNFAGKLYQAPTGLAGKRVQLLYDEQDPARIEVLYDNTSRGFLVPLNPEINSRVRRAGGETTELIPEDRQPCAQPDEHHSERYRSGELFRDQEQS